MGNKNHPTVKSSGAIFNSLASLPLAIKEKLTFDEQCHLREAIKESWGDEFGSGRVFNGIAELPGSPTAEEIPQTPVILRRKRENLVQKVPPPRQCRRPTGFYLGEAGWV